MYIFLQRWSGGDKSGTGRAPRCGRPGGSPVRMVARGDDQITDWTEATS